MYTNSEDLISLEEILKLDDSDKILVSRVMINAALVKVQAQEISENTNEEYLILKKTIRRMLMEKKKKDNGPVLGTLMTIKDVKKAIIPNTTITTFKKTKTKPNYSDEKVIKGQKSIFLAGPTPRDKNIISWREEALLKLSELEFDGVVYIPELSTMKSKDDYVDQAEWEREALTEATSILFWIPRDLETMPAFTTNVEFGYWISKKRILYGRPDGAPKTKYLDWLYSVEYNDVPYNNLSELLEASCMLIRENQQIEDAPKQKILQRK